MKEMEVNNFEKLFTIEKLNEPIKVLKQRKAAGVDEVMSEQKTFWLKNKKLVIRNVQRSSKDKRNA